MVTRSRAPLPRLVVAGLAALVAVMIAGGTAGRRNVDRLYENSRWVMHTHDVIDALSSVRFDVGPAITAWRAFLPSGDEKLLAPASDALTRSREDLARLTDLTRDNRRQQARLGELSRSVEKVGALIEHTRRLRREPTFDLEREERALFEQPPELIELRSIVEDMQGEERRLLAEREQASRRAHAVALSAGTVSAILGIVTVGLFAWLLARYLRSRDRAEAEIWAQSELLEATLASIGDAVIATDARGLVTSMNAVAARLTGFAAAEAIRRPLTEVFHIVNGDSRRPVENPVAKVLEAGSIVGLANHTVLVARDGSKRPIDDSAAPIRDRSGALVGAVLVFRDVSHRRQIEAELLQANRRKDEFLALLAHELRNPLAPIRNGLQLQSLGTLDRDGLERVQGMMQRQLEHLVRLVDDLLDVSRINQDKLELRLEVVNLVSVVRSALEICGPALAARKHRVATRLPPFAVHVRGDGHRLTQAVSNVLSNAGKYTPDGGSIEVTLAALGEEATITVRDDGVGIPQAMLARIFDLFAQVDPSLERRQGGLGVGLTIVKRLVEMHGGRIEVTSAGPGTGSQFVLGFPVMPAAAAASESRGHDGVAPPRATTPRRILVVDDNQDAATSLAMLLSFEGHETFTAHDGRAGIELAERTRPDVVILDVGMPDLNGFEVCRRIRAEPWAHGMVLIALTGFGQDLDRQRSLDAGFDHHLVKPLDLPVLETLLGNLGVGRAASRDSASAAPPAVGTV